VSDSETLQQRVNLGNGNDDPILDAIKIRARL